MALQIDFLLMGARTIFAKIIDLVCLFTFVTYVIGGYSLDGRTGFGYVGDLFRLTAVLVFIGFLFHLKLADLFIFRGFKNFENWLLRKDSLRFPGVFVITGCKILFLCFLAVPLLRHWGYGTFFWDMAVMEQVIWRGAFGYGISSTAILGLANAPLDFFKNQHLNFWLFPTAGLFRLFPHTETLLLLQSVGLLLTFVPLWKISKELSPKWLPIFFLPALYWCLQTIHRNNVWDIHEACFLPMVSLWAYYFYIKRKWLGVVVFTLAVGLFKEDAWVLAGAMGFYFFSNEKKWIPAALCLLLGFSVYLSYSLFFNKVHVLGYRYSYLGETFSQTIPILKKNPLIIIQYLFTPGSLLFLGSIALLTGGLWLLGGWAIVAIIPTLLECTLSTSPAVRSFDFHYAIAFMGPLLYSAARGIQKIDSLKLNLYTKKAILIFALALSLSQLTYSEPIAIKNITHSWGWRDRTCFSKLIEKIPSDAPVYAMEPIAAHLAGRALFFTYPNWLPEYAPNSWIVTHEGNLPKGFEIVDQGCDQILASNRSAKP